MLPAMAHKRNPLPPASWWRDGVLYQIYPRSFADSNGDGIGDLRGIVSRLDHLEWLGIDGIWLNPTMPSPNEDWGYDVADYVGRASGPRDAGGSRRAGRGCGRARDTGPARPGPEPLLRPPCVVRRRALGPRRPLPRLLRVGRPETRRRPAQQLAVELRRQRLDAARADRSVLPAQLPRRASPTSTGGTTRCGTRSTTSCASGSTAASPASGSTSATRSSRTASCATTRRSRRTTIPRCASARSSRCTR